MPTNVTDAKIDPLASNGGPTLISSLFAARRPDGTLTLMVVNLGSSPVEKPLTLTGFAPAATAETWLFDESSPAGQVDSTPLGAAVTLRLPAESMTLLVAEQAK